MHEDHLTLKAMIIKIAQGNIGGFTAMMKMCEHDDGFPAVTALCLTGISGTQVHILYKYLFDCNTEALNHWLCRATPNQLELARKELTQERNYYSDVCNSELRTMLGIPEPPKRPAEATTARVDVTETPIGEKAHENI